MYLEFMKTNKLIDLACYYPNFHLLAVFLLQLRLSNILVYLWFSGVISGALLYIRDDFSAVDRKTWLQVMSSPVFLR